MSLHTALSLFLEEYPLALQRPFAGDSVAAFIRRDVPDVITKMLQGNPRYQVVGSPGKGNWACVPWAAIFDRFITESAQDGYYLVYLVREDFSGVYISLNQGITSVRKQYKTEAKTSLKVRAADYLARLGPISPEIHTGPIDLASTKSSSLSSFYEAGSICSLHYSQGAIPLDDELAEDLKKFRHLYLLLASKEAHLHMNNEIEEDESYLGEEDLVTLREHKRIERNKKLTGQAKKIHGYVCKACGFNFEKVYGEIGRNFIEAHHLTPLSELKGLRLKLNPKWDFTVLCSNCHRMIHRTSDVSKIEDFRTHYFLKNNKAHDI